MLQPTSLSGSLWGEATDGRREPQERFAIADLSETDLRQVAQWADEIEIGAGTPLVREGDFAYEFFVIEEGTARVLHEGKSIAELGPGDFFGEIALLETARRTASVVAATPMRLIVMFGREFRSLGSTFPDIAEKVRRVVAERLGA